MSDGRRPFTCYFCNKSIVNETEMGHTTLCSKVLIPCPYKCGSYVQRSDLQKHKTECNNNIRKTTPQEMQNHNSKSLDRRQDKSKLLEEVITLKRRLSELESGLSTKPADEVAKLSSSVQRFNYFIGIISEWRKNMEAQLATAKTSLISLEGSSKEKMQNIKEATHKDITLIRQAQMDFQRNLDDIRTTFNNQNISFEKMWLEQAEVVNKIIKDIELTFSMVDEQKAKYAGLVFDLRSVSLISSEAAEKIEIMEREFKTMRQEVSQMKVNMDILEDLTINDNTTFQRLIWRVPEVHSKLKRAKENDIVLKSPIFFTHRYGYKIRVLLYINGLKKWKDRYALACIHVLKGTYDLLLPWPCTIEGHITLRDLSDQNHPKNFTKYIKTKKHEGDEEEDEPQESSSTYIFIPHSVLFKECYVKDDMLFLDVSINRFETIL